MPKEDTQFKKGQSGNPGGRPKRAWTWAGLIQEAVEDKAKDGTEIKVHVARSLVAKALQGDIAAQKEIMNRMDGFPMQPTDISSLGDKLENIIIYRPKRPSDK